MSLAHRPEPNPQPVAKRRTRRSVLTLSNVQAILIMLALAGYPLVATISTALSLNGSVPAITLRAAILTISIALILPAISRIKRRHLKYLVVFVTFWVAYLMRMVADTTSDSDQLSKAASEYWIWAVGVCLIPALALMGVSLPSTIPRAFKSTWLSLGISVGLAIFFGSTLAMQADGTQNETGRLALNSLNPISAGHLGASLVILSGWYWWTEKEPISSLKAASLLGMLAGLYLLISSASRGPLIAFLSVIVIVMLTMRIRRFIKITAFASLITAPILPIVLRLVELDTLVLVARIAASTGGEDMSVASRQDSFAGAWNQFISNPLLGDFLDERSTGFYPHNLVLEAFMSTGLIGGLAFLSISIIATWKAFRLVKLRSPFAWTGLIYIQYLTGAQLSGSLYASSIFWAFTVLMIFTNQSSSNDIYMPKRRHFTRTTNLKLTKHSI